MSERDYQEIREMLMRILDCKTQAHRKLAIEFILQVIREKAKLQ